MKTLKLTNGYLVTPDSIKKQDLIIRNGTMSLAGGMESCETIDIAGKYVVPGFVDIHFHGFNLFEFTAGHFDPVSQQFDSSEAAYAQGFAMIAREMAKRGTTGVYLSTWAAPAAAIRRALELLARDMKEVKESRGARLLGSFIEGSFISPAMTGAQNPDAIMDASLESYEHFAVPEVIKLVNVAPERGPQAMELIRTLARRGIVVGCGHTAATADQINAAAQAGLKYFVHFLNGPTGHNYKPFDGGGAVEAVLTNDEIYAEQICDGAHINPAYVRGVIARKGVEKVIVVTDALYVAGSQVRDFLLGGVAGRVSDDGRCAYVVNKPNTLCSSMLTMDKGFCNMLNWLSSDIPGIWTRMHSRLSFEQSMTAAARMCSTNPNTLMGRKNFGTITQGAAADICVLDIAGSAGNYSTAVDMTVVDGTIVYRKAH